MATNELLAIYLNDHLAGAAAGSELAQKISTENAGTPYGKFLSELAGEIDEDRATLDDLMTRLDIEKNPLKQAAGWLLEKLSRIKLSDTLTGSADLKRLLEFEALSLGIEGKLCMWRALQKVADNYPEMAAADLPGLVKRAEDQRVSLEEHRLDLASKALSG